MMSEGNWPMPTRQPEPTIWANGNELTLILDSPHGWIYARTFPLAVMDARIGGEEILRFTWDIVDPEDGTTTSGAARLVLQELEDPRVRKAEEQPAKPADATAQWKCADCGYEDSEYSLVCPNCATDGELMEEQSAKPADAAAPKSCEKCRRHFDPDDTRHDGEARHKQTPFCRQCVDQCQSTEIADHWCAVDQYRQQDALTRAVEHADLFRQSGPAGPTARVNW